MDDHIENFINLLNSNSFTAKTYLPSNLDDTYDPTDWIFYEEDIVNSNWYSYDELKVGIVAGEIEQNIFTIFQLNGFNKPSDLEDFLFKNFELFKDAFTSNNYKNNKTVKDEIVSQIRLIRNKLEMLLDYTVRIHNHSLNSLIKAKIDICAETLRFINYSIIPVSSKDEIQASSQPVSINLRTRKNFENLTDLTQNQVIILSYYLKKLGCLGKSMPKNLFATQIAELSGYSNEKIRQDLSHIANPESYEFSESDYLTVRRIVKKILEEVEQDCQKIFSSKF